MSTAPKCKICGTNHGPGAPHSFAADHPAKVALGIDPAAPQSPMVEKAFEGADQVIRRLHRKIAELEAERDQAAANGYRIHMRELMRKRRAAAKERS